MSTLRPGKFALHLLLLTLTAAALPALEIITDGPAERRVLSEKVRLLFRTDEFAQIDALAETFWQERTRFTDGTWKLAQLYDALGVPTTQRAKTDWRSYLARFERWQQKSPTSTTARIGHAVALTSYAWEARGGGYADTVSEAGWKLFAARLTQARAVLDAEPSAQQRPGYYSAMMTVALGLQWPRPDYDRLFESAVKLAPDYESFYFRRANYLQPKWHGTTPDEWHRFARDSATATRAQQGEIFYARIVWATIGATDKNLTRFRAEQIDWPRMRRGFEDLEKQYPESLWNRNAFCFYAWAANDRATAQRLFDNLKGRYAPTIWGDAATFEKAQSWARGQPTKNSPP